MKIKFLTVITSLLTAAFMITSCLDDNEVETEYSSESSITAFAIKDKIETQYTEKVNGKDTTLTFTVDGTKYPFAIDQGTRAYLQCRLPASRYRHQQSCSQHNIRWYRSFLLLQRTKIRCGMKPTP